MRDRLRAARDAAAELAEKAQRLIPGGKSDVDDPSDDEDDEDLPEVDASSPVDKELARLDGEDAEPISARRRPVAVRRPPRRSTRLRRCP